MPVQRPERFDLVIDLKTAEALGFPCRPCCSPPPTRLSNETGSMSRFDPKRTSIGPPNCLTVQTLEVACIGYSGPGSHSQLRNGSGSPRREAQPTIWKRSDSGGLAQSWSAPLIAIVRCGLALQAS